MVNVLYVGKLILPPFFGYSFSLTKIPIKKLNGDLGMVYGIIIPTLYPHYKDLTNKDRDFDPNNLDLKQVGIAHDFTSCCLFQPRNMWA